MAEPQQYPRLDALDVLVSVLSELDSDAESGASGAEAGAHGFYDRLCEATCRLTSMRRALLLLYDSTRKLVVPVGSHGLPPETLDQIYGTLEETPIAQRALAEDRVIERSDLGGELPTRYAHFPGLTTLTCTPVAAAGRRLGVIFADRGGGRFRLTDHERHALWTLGKTAALAASAQIATTQYERARLLGSQVDLAREVHERVVQRLFGVSLALGSGRELTAEERARCASEIGGALADLRTALSRPLASTQRPRTVVTLRAEAERLTRHYPQLPISVDWQLTSPLPEQLEHLTQAVLAEALSNAAKHATPSWVEVTVDGADGAFVLEVRNDGAHCERAGQGPGMGLRLAAFEALEHGGVVEFGPCENGEWRVRLVVSR